MFTQTYVNIAIAIALFIVGGLKTFTALQSVRKDSFDLLFLKNASLMKSSSIMPNVSRHITFFLYTTTKPQSGQFLELFEIKKKSASTVIFLCFQDIQISLRTLGKATTLL